MEEFPLVYACEGYENQIRLISVLGILSKKEMKRLGIWFCHSHTASNDLEQLLGTYNDVTLAIDPNLNKQWLYAGMIGPRILINPNLVFRDDVFILPTDQSAYSPTIDGSLFERFEQDKAKTREQKTTLVSDRMKSKVQGYLEVNVPGVVSPEHFIGVLAYEERLEEMKRAFFPLQVVAYKNASGTNFPGDNSYFEAYEQFLKVTKSVCQLC